MPNDAQEIAVITDVTPERPSVMVLHLPSGKPATGAGPLPHDRTMEFFREAVRSCRGLPGLRRVTIELSETDEEGRKLLERLGSEVTDGGLELCAVVLADSAAA